MGLAQHGERASATLWPHPVLESLFERQEARLAVALVIGLVLGAEREQRHATTTGVDRPGVRTFALVAMLGAAAALLGDATLLAALGVAVGACAVASFVLSDRADAGLTTEIALLVTYALGALAIRMPEIALAAGVSAAVLLAFRAQLHGAVRETLSPAELRDALIVAAAALVVLPMLPDRPLDPWHALSPFVLWRLVVAAMAIAVAARALERFVGPRWGPAIAGLASGFVSSSATIAAMGAKAKSDPLAAEPALMTAAGSTVATFVQMAILIATASPPLFLALAPALVAGAATALGYTAWAVLRAAARDRPEEARARVVSIRAALIFAALVGGITLLSSAVAEELGSSGAVVAAAVAALADAHAAAASAASLHATARLTTDEAALAALLCLTTNTVTKIVLAFTSGPRRFGREVTVGLVLVLGVAWIAWGAGHALGFG